MSYTIKYCKNCNRTQKNTAYIFDEYKYYFAGYLSMDGDLSNTNKCPWCGEEIIDTFITKEDFRIIDDVSNRNRQLLDAMVELRQKDIIEYELKMSQFRQLDPKSQNNQRQSNPNSNRPTSPSQYSTTYTRDNTPAKVWSAPQNVPKCPTCGSTNIHKISAASKAGSVALWGIFSRKVHKQWHCDNCRSEW